MKHKVESLPGRLYADMSHLQPHLSVGQKQLLCLARVLLKPNPKILIIEETMDNVDPRFVLPFRCCYVLPSPGAEIV